MNLLNSLSAVFVVWAFVIAIVIAFSLRQQRQSMPIMNSVWVLTGLWAGLAALWGYFKFGVQRPTKMQMSVSMGGMTRPGWQSVALSTLHCGAGCTLADIIGEWGTYFVPVSLFGGWAVDYVLALCIGVYFQYAVIQSMGRVEVGQALKRAFKADFLSLTAWQVGMYGWMAVVFFVIFPNQELPKTEWTFWFMMQVAMMWGFVFSWQVNRLLLRMGIKKAM